MRCGHDLHSPIGATSGLFRFEKWRKCLPTPAPLGAALASRCLRRILARGSAKSPVACASFGGAGARGGCRRGRPCRVEADVGGAPGGRDGRGGRKGGGGGGRRAPP